ncbi:MAG TPA: hypothetical protein VGF69_04715 [Thermoanaerobaculia bacterium]|jgi:ribosomal protein L19
MWVFDGEEWRQDDGSEESTTVRSISNNNGPELGYDMFLPELQVIEVPLPRTVEIPLFPIV